MKLPVIAIAILLVAGCNKAGPAPGANQAGPAGQTATGGTAPPVAPAAVDRLQPGAWEMTMRVASIEMPNAPPEMLEQLRAQPLPPPQIQRSCITPDEASNPTENFRRQMAANQNLSCEMGDGTFGGGRIRIALNCRGANGQADQRMAMVGSFTATSMQVAVSADTTTPATGGMAPQAIRVQSTMTGRRVGECNGTETQ
jgi:Protein of unknown function (DUF3617)